MSAEETRQRFRDLYCLHRRRGEIRPLQKYQRIFHGHGNLIAEEYDRIRHEEVLGASAFDDEGTIRDRRSTDKVELTLDRLTPVADGRYKKRGELGRGAMGTVFEVRDGTLGRHVAMKVISDSFADTMRVARGAATGVQEAPTLVKRFVQEARITSYLDHPGVPAVHEFGIDDEGNLFFTMKLVDGQSLSDVLRGMREAPEEWPLTRVLGIFVRICDTLAFAHSKGVVHRDLKPENVMVGSFGEVYVMDWGLAKVLHDAPVASTDEISNDGDSDQTSFGPSSAFNETVHGHALGSPPFMPPEQAFGLINDIGPHSDVYALGAMLYELLTGYSPYTHPGGPTSGVGIIAAVKAGPPPRVREVAPAADEELAAIAAKAMARLASQRYQSMTAFGEDLQNYLHGRVVKAYGGSGVMTVRKWITRNRALATALCGMLVSLLAGGVVLAAQERTAREDLGRERDKARATAVEQRRERVRADGLRLCATSLALGTAQPTEALLLAAEGAELAPGLDATNALYAALARQREMLYMDGHSTYVLDAELSADGAHVLSIGNVENEAGGVILWDARTGELLHRLDPSLGRVKRAQFSPDGRFVLTQHESGTLRTWSVATGRPVGSYEAGEPRPVRTVFRGYDDELLVLRADGGVEIRNAESLDRIRALPTVVDAKDAGYLDAGRRMYTTHENGEVVIRNPASGEEIGYLSGPRPSGSAPTVAFDVAGRYALLTDTVTHLVRVEDGQVLRSFERGESVRISDSGDRLVTLRSQERSGALTTDVHAFALPALEPISSFRSDCGMAMAELDPVGRRLLFARSGSGFAIDVYSVDTGLREAVLAGHTYHVTALRCSRDGRLAVTSSNDQTVRVWRLDDGSDPVPRFAHAARPPIELATSPDRRLAIVRELDESGAATGPFEVRERESGMLRFAIPSMRGVVDRAQFDPTGQFVLARHGSGAMRTFTLWDAGEGLLRGTIEKAPSEASFSENGRALSASDRRGLVATYSVPDGAPIARAAGLSQDAVRSVSGDGRRVAIAPGDRRVIQVYDLERGELCGELVGHTGTLLSLRLNGDGTRLVSSAADASVRVWDVDAGECMSVTRGLEMGSIDLRLSLDDRFILAASPSRVRLIESATGDQVADLEPVSGRFRSAWFDPDGVSFRTSGDLGVLRWPLDPLAEARARAPRDIDASLLRRYGIGTEEERDERQARIAQTTTSSTTVASWGVRCLERGAPQEAIAAFQRGIELNPDCYRSHLGLARAHCHMAALRPDTPEGQEERQRDRAAALRSVAELTRTAPWLSEIFESDPASAEITSLPDYAALRRR